VRELVRQHVPSMDHVEVLVRLSDREGTGMTGEELQATTRLEAKGLDRSLEDLVNARIVRFDAPTATWHYDPRSDRDRAAVQALTTLYHQRPVTLVKLIYSMPSRAITTFADAFRLREDDS
jgi:hypothetical protein